MVAITAPICRFVEVRALSPRDPAAFWRDTATPEARISYEGLQIVAAELPEDLVLCSGPTLAHARSEEEPLLLYGRHMLTTYSV